jgi:hypothetical protein
MADTVFAESLAYNQMKKRAVSARSYRVKIAPTNGTTFSPGSTIQVDLSGNQAGTYYNFNQMYIKIKVANTDAFTWDRAGALGLIKRLQISTAGSQLCDINNYNVLATALMDTDSSMEYKAGYGALLLGTSGDSLSGKVVDAGQFVTYCIPIVLNPLAQTTPHRMIPAFSLSSIQLRMTLDSSDSSCLSAGVAFGENAFSEVEMVCMMTELSSDAQAKVDASTGGKYDILATSWMQSAGTKAADVTSLTQNLGFSMSSLERVIAIHRPSSSVGLKTAFSLGNRGTGGLTQYSYSINSEMYPARPILVENQGAEACAELLVADHSLVDFKKSCGLTNAYTKTTVGPYGSSALTGIDPTALKNPAYNLNVPAGTNAGAPNTDNISIVDSNIGTFVAGCEFENSLSDGKSAVIYSGISTMSSTVQFIGTYNAVAACNVDWFAQYSVLFSLNMRGTGVWGVSV